MDDKEIDKAFKTILDEEYDHGWKRFTVSRNMVAFISYAFPALLMVGTQNYHMGNMFVTLLFSGVFGTGIYYSASHYLAMKAFFKTEKPTVEVFKEIREQEELDAKFSGSPLHLPVKDIDWDDMFSRMEQAMAETTGDSDAMSLDTLLDRGETVERTRPRTRFAAFVSRLFRRS